MTIPPIGVPHSTGLEITLEKDGNLWVICPPDSDPDNSCDGELNHLAANGQVVGIPSKEPYTWTSFSLDAGFESPPLNGYRVGVRYYEQFSFTVTIPPGPDGPNGEPGTPGSSETTYTRSYPGFDLISQTLEQEGDNKFRTSTGNELFTAAPGDYAGDSYAMAGITNGTQYSYVRVFDQADISYVPRLSCAGQFPVTNGVIPSEPLDEDADPPLYPFDLLTSFLPDERDSVTVGYILTTVWNAGTADVTTQVTISQPCTQDTDFSNIGDKIRSYTQVSYFGNELPHIGLYPAPGSETEGFDLPNYDDNGDLEKGVINEPFNMKQLTRNSYPLNFEMNKFRPYPEDQN